MTTITIAGDGTDILRMAVEGHAGYATRGEDIVCAGASVLITTCINALETVAGIVPRVTQDEKRALIALTLPEGLKGQAMHDAQIVLRTALQGFEDLSSAYPEYISMIDGRKPPC